MTKVSLIFMLSCSCILISSCFKKVNYPLEPIISNPSFIIYADSAVLTFEFTDGDGDIGLSNNEMSPPYDSTSYYYYNLYVDYYEKDDVNGWQRGLNLAGDSITFAYRLKPIIIKGKERGIKGKMDVTMKTYKNPFSSQSDTIKFTIKLIDRSLNESNTIETNEIVS